MTAVIDFAMGAVAVEIMMQICKGCKHREHCYKPCPYVWRKVIENERRMKDG